MKKRLRVEHFSVAYQAYIFPTVRWTYDSDLNGYKSIEIIWLTFGIEVSIYNIEHE